MSTRSTTASGRAKQSAHARFAARARAVRRRARLPVAVAGAVGVGVAALAALVAFGPLAVVRQVQVSGVRPAEIGSVRAVGEREVGRPLARVDTAGVAEEVSRLPFVRSVRVQRGWPSTLRLVVQRRVPVAAVPRLGGGFELVDGTGTAYETAPRAPSGVPVVLVDLRAAGQGSLAAALAVLAALPASLRPSVSQVSATSPDDVRMRLGGAQVLWGNGQDTALKVRVLMSLRSSPAAVYDVSSPGTPVLR